MQLSLHSCPVLQESGALALHGACVGGWLILQAGKIPAHFSPIDFLANPVETQSVPLKNYLKKFVALQIGQRSLEFALIEELTCTDKCSAFVADGLQATKLIFRHLWGEVRFPHSLIGTLAKPWSVPLNNPLKFP